MCERCEDCPLPPSARSSEPPRSFTVHRCPIVQLGELTPEMMELLIRFYGWGLSSFMQQFETAHHVMQEVPCPRSRIPDIEKAEIDVRTSLNRLFPPPNLENQSSTSIPIEWLMGRREKSRRRF